MQPKRRMCRMWQSTRVPALSCLRVHSAIILYAIKYWVAERETRLTCSCAEQTAELWLLLVRRFGLGVTRSQAAMRRLESFPPKSLTLGCIGAHLKKWFRSLASDPPSGKAMEV